MFNFIKQAFIAVLSFSESLARTVEVFDRTKCIFLNNGLCLARATLMKLNRNKLHYHPIMDSLDRCNGSYNILGDPSGRI